MCTTCEIQGSRTWLHPFKAMEQRPAPNQDMQATCVHTERSDRIVSSSCIVLARCQIRLCPVVNFGDQQTYQRDTGAARNRHECKEEKSTAQDTSCSSGGRRMTVLEASLGGSGKLGGEGVVARLSKDAIAGIQQLCSDGLEHELRPILEPFKVAVSLFFQMKQLNKDRFQLDTDSENFVFATASKKQGCRPNMSRQSVSEALSR